MLDIKDLYQQHVSTCASKFKQVYLNSLELAQITHLAKTIVDAKRSEVHHKADGASELKRFINGLKGEYAVAKYLKINTDVINTKVGNSSDFNIPDIPGYNVGVKTVEYGHFPIIFKENSYPQIICICHPNVNDIVYICGLADADTLNKCQHEDLILDPNLKAKGTKTGFWGFSSLKEVSEDTLKPYIETPAS